MAARKITITVTEATAESWGRDIMHIQVEGYGDWSTAASDLGWAHKAFVNQEMQPEVKIDYSQAHDTDTRKGD